MPNVMQTLGIDRMSVDERIALVNEIWESIEADRVANDLTEAQRAELDRRLAALDADPTNVLTWKEIKAHVRRER